MKFLRQSLLSTMLILSAVGFQTPVSAQPINVGSFVISDCKGPPPCGLINAFWAALDDYSDLSVSVTHLPYPRMFKALEAGDISYAGFFRSKASEAIADPLIKLFESDVIVVRRDGLAIQSYDDLKRLNIVKPRGVRYNHRFDDDPDISKLLVPTYKEAMEMLKRGHANAVIGPADLLARGFAAEKLDPGLIAAGFILATREAWLHRSRRTSPHPDEVILLKHASALIRAGVFASITPAPRP